MTTKAIQNSEIEDLKISSLPTNPTADPNYGGLGYSASEMKAAFDRLPLFIIDRLNSLIADISSSVESSVSSEIKTGLRDNWEHSLKDFFDDVKNGQLASYLAVGEYSLATQISNLKSEIDAIKSILGLGVSE